MKREPHSPPPVLIDDRDTGLPGFRSWRRVYILMLGVFVLWVVLLVAFTRAFS